MLTNLQRKEKILIWANPYYILQNLFEAALCDECFNFDLQIEGCCFKNDGNIFFWNKFPFPELSNFPWSSKSKKFSSVAPFYNFSSYLRVKSISLDLNKNQTQKNSSSNYSVNLTSYSICQLQMRCRLCMDNYNEMWSFIFIVVVLYML